jgi:hypothetical protein
MTVPSNTKSKKRMQMPKAKKYQTMVTPPMQKAYANGSDFPYLESLDSSNEYYNEIQIESF